MFSDSVKFVYILANLTNVITETSLRPVLVCSVLSHI